jgi:hypothetical protein
MAPLMINYEIEDYYALKTLEKLHSALSNEV